MNNFRLKYVRTVLVSGLETFYASQNFRKDQDALILIGWIGEGFKENFLDLREETCKATEIKVHKVLRSSPHHLVLKNLNEGEITLGQFFQLLPKKGEDTHYQSIAYIRDVSGITRAVSAVWNPNLDALNIDADPITYEGGAFAGFNVFSR